MAQGRIAVGDVVPYPSGPVVRTESWGVDPEVLADEDPTGAVLLGLTDLLAQLSGSDGTEAVRDEAASLLHDLREDPLLGARFADRRFRDRFQVRWLRMVEESTPETRAAWLRPEPDPDVPELVLVDVGAWPKWPEPFASDPTWVAWSERWLQRRARHASLRRDSWTVRLVTALSQLFRRGGVRYRHALRTGLMPLAALELHLLARTRWEQDRAENVQRLRQLEQIMRSRARPALHPELMAREQERMLREGPELVGRASELGVTQEEWDEARRSGRTLSIFGLALADDAQVKREAEHETAFRDAVEALRKDLLADDDPETQDPGANVRLQRREPRLVNLLRRVRETLPLATGPRSLLPGDLVVADGHLIARGNIIGAVLGMLDRGLLVRRFESGSERSGQHTTQSATDLTGMEGELAALGLQELDAILIPWSSLQLLTRDQGKGSLDLYADAETLAADAIEGRLVEGDRNNYFRHLPGWSVRDEAEHFLAIVDLLGRGRFAEACAAIADAPHGARKLLTRLYSRRRRSGRSKGGYGDFDYGIDLQTTSGDRALSFESGRRFGARDITHRFWSVLFELTEGLLLHRHLSLRFVSEAESPNRGGRRNFRIVEDGELILPESIDGRERLVREHAAFAVDLQRWTDPEKWERDLQALGLPFWFASEVLHLTQRYSLDGLTLGAGDIAGADGAHRRMVTLCFPTVQEWRPLVERVKVQRLAEARDQAQEQARVESGTSEQGWARAVADGVVVTSLSPHFPDQDADYRTPGTLATLAATDAGLAIHRTVWDPSTRVGRRSASFATDGVELIPWRAIETIETRTKKKGQETGIIVRRLGDEPVAVALPDSTGGLRRFLAAARARVPDAASRARDLDEAVRRAQSQARIDSGSDKRDWDEAVASGRVVTVTHAMGRTVDIDGQRVAARLRITTAAATDAGLVTHSTVWDATKGPDPREGSYTQGEAELMPWRSVSSIRRTAMTVTIESVTGRTIRIDIANAPRVDADDPSLADGELMTDTEAIARTVPLFVEAAQRKIAATH